MGDSSWLCAKETSTHLTDEPFFYGATKLSLLHFPTKINASRPREKQPADIV